MRQEQLKSVRRGQLLGVHQKINVPLISIDFSFRLKAKQKLKNKKGKNDKKANKESSDDDKELVEEKQAEEEPEVLDLTEKVE